MKHGTGLIWPVLAFWVGVLAPLQPVSAARPATPVISIIIDDMGKTLAEGRRVLGLPGPVACAFLPRAAHTTELAVGAHTGGKEVMLHLPMDSVDARPLDPGAVTLNMTRGQFVATVEANLAAVPYVQGINNHMGSLLTRHPGHMLWLMQEMQRHEPLFFVDSRTTVATVARQVAHENGIPSTDRNVFLDHQPEVDEIERQFDRLLRLARKYGSALAIGHPHPQTLDVLEQRLPSLESQGVRLLPVAELIRLQQEDEQTWQASWSPSPKAAKN
ncbi:MAG: divergent polysaccharide deacetylase family protein [Gammaproteobacteria bacterium]|jgi:polysaccharide deacetylase 2 family uncharacterized protein YibQ